MSKGRGGEPVASVMVAPNAFKGSLTALEAAAVMAAAVSVVHPDAHVTVRPIADGGDGSVEALLSAGYDRLDVPVHGQGGREVTAALARREGRCVVELANTCGLLLSPPGARDPMGSSTHALGEAVRAALDDGAREIVLCVGGSASTDGGVGLVTALGARVRDAGGAEVPPGGAWLADIDAVDLDGLDPRLHDVRLVVATDVDSPLYGPEGAAVVFAPQKGATAEEVARLDAGLRSWAAVVAGTTGRDDSHVPGAGAAGGTAFAAIALLGASVMPGAAFIAEAIGLEPALSSADLVITGEGSLDGQSLRGKGAVAVARAAHEQGTPCVMVCGQIDLHESELRDLGVTAWGALTDGTSLTDALTRPAELLARRTVEVLAAEG